MKRSSPAPGRRAIDARVIRTTRPGAAPQSRNAAAPAARPGRRTQVERTETTRKKLVDATIAVMRKRGYGGLTTAEVADVAGVSRGALLHHFPTRHDLVVATMRYMNDLILVESRRRAAEAAGGSGAPIDGVIRDAKDFFFREQWGSVCGSCAGA